MKLKYVFSSLGILICLSVFADGVKPAKVGEQSPDFQFADKNGKMYSLKDFKGQYVFIDIWATHCFPCKEEIPYLGTFSK
jgi:thiol-disulfide isomerase/thioredoxin